MKVIDLLNKIANKECLPNLIKYDNCIYYKNGSNEYIKVGNLGTFMQSVYEIDLNKEIEILDDEVEIQKTNVVIRELNPQEAFFKDGTEIVHKLMYNKINEIVRLINQSTAKSQFKECDDVITVDYI